MSKIKFNKFNVTNGTDKARVYYSLDNRVDGRKVVTLYDKDYGSALSRVFPNDPNYVNKTDIRDDYFDKGSMRIFEDSPYYVAARARAESVLAARQ